MPDSLPSRACCTPMPSAEGVHADGYGRLALWSALVGTIIAISYLGAAEDPPEDVLYTWSAAISGLFYYALVLAAVLLISRGRTASLLALRAPPSWARAAVISLGLLLAIFALNGVVEIFLDPGEEQGLVPEDWDPSRADAFAANFVVVALLAPIAEELMFRGLGFSLLRRFGRIAAILVVGIAFGLAHGLVEALPLLAAFGIALAYLRSETASVIPPIILHSLFNAIALIASVSS